MFWAYINDIIQTTMVETSLSESLIRNIDIHKKGQERVTIYPVTCSCLILKLMILIIKNFFSF